MHPALPIDESRRSDPKYFASLDFMAELKSTDLPGFRKAQISNIEYINLWDDLAEDFRRLNEGRLELLRPKYEGDDANTQAHIIAEAIDIAGLFLEGKWTTMQQAAKGELNKAKQHPNFAALKSYLEGYKDEFLLRRAYELMRDYRSVETELLSTLLSQKQGKNLKGLSSSAKWEKIERVYGDFYEIYGELAVIPTVINNLLARNNYDQFATTGFTLPAYLETDKAGRMKNFANNPGLYPLGGYYEAWLRNGTHHKTAQINKAKQKIVVKIGKGGASDKVLSFIEYTAYCNELYTRCLIVLTLFHDIVA